MKFTKCLMLLLGMIMFTSAFAVTPTYKVCDAVAGTNQYGQKHINCSNYTLKQEDKIIEVELEDPEVPGSSFLKRIRATNIVRCNAQSICAIESSSIYRVGTVVGNSPEGYYTTDHNSYMEYDTAGRATQYRIGTGPRFNGPRSGATSSPPPTQQVVVFEASCAPQMDDECTINNKKVPRAQLGNYLPVVNEDEVELAGGVCEYPICYGADYKPVGIRAE